MRDRLVQLALLNHLELDPKFHVKSPISYGFTKGKTLSDAQRRALELRSERPWVLKADIIKFFDQIPRKEVKDLVTKSVKRKIVRELLHDAIDCELEGRSDLALTALNNGIQKGRGLRQGMPVSPMLSNLLLKDLDMEISRNGITAIRYADDIAVFANNKNQCRDAFKLIKFELGKLGLDIPDPGEDSKTVICGPEESIDFLGVEIRRAAKGYTLHAPTKKLAQIESKMTEIASVATCIKKRQNIGHVVRQLDAFTAGYRQAMDTLTDKESFLERLEAMKRKHIKDMLVSMLGAKIVDEMCDDYLAILGVQSF